MWCRAVFVGEDNKIKFKGATGAAGRTSNIRQDVLARPRGRPRPRKRWVLFIRVMIWGTQIGCAPDERAMSSETNLLRELSRYPETYLIYRCESGDGWMRLLLLSYASMKPFDFPACLHHHDHNRCATRPFMKNSRPSTYSAVPFNFFQQQSS